MELQREAAPGAVSKQIKSGSRGMSVTVLKRSDVTIKNQKVYMPNTIEMALVKKSERGQFMTHVPVASSMTVEQIENLLQEYFPCLLGQRFYCAAAVDNRTRLDFHGSPRIWDGSFIKKNIKGNSALYIFAEESGRPQNFGSHVPEQAGLVGSQGQCVSQEIEDSGQPLRMGAHVTCTNSSNLLLESEIQGPRITTCMSGILSNNFVCHSSVASATVTEVNQASLHLSEMHSSPQEENPLNGTPNTQNMTSYDSPSNVSQMFCTDSLDSLFQDLPDLQDLAYIPSFGTSSASEVDSGWQDDGDGLSSGIVPDSPDLDNIPFPELFNGDAILTTSQVDVQVDVEVDVDGQSPMDIQPVVQSHTHPSGSVETNHSGSSERPSVPGSDLGTVHQDGDHYSGVSRSVQGISPPEGPTEGGYLFYISLSEPLPEDVTSGKAEFCHVHVNVHIATAKLTKLNPHVFQGTVPGSPHPGVVQVTVMTQTGQHLGITCFKYFDDITKTVKQVVRDPAKQAKLFRKLSEECTLLSDSSNQTKQQHSVQFLQLLVYTAAQTGEKQFIEIIFSTSAGQIVFDSYKDRAQLPEDVARANGHDDLANYLQDFTTRFSKEQEFSRKEAHVIDWSELEAAAIAAQTQGCLTEEKSSDDSSENNSDTDYFADVETSSIDSSELSRSTSVDDTSEPSSRDKTKALAHESISSIGKWAFTGNGTMGKIRQIIEGVQRKSCVLVLRDNHFDCSLLGAVKGMDYTLAFHLANGSKNIPRHLHTANERFLVLRDSIVRQPTISFCKLHPYPDVLIESSLVKNNNGFISRTVASKQRHWNQLNEDIVAELATLMPIEKDIAVEWKSSGTFGKEFGAHTHCDLWVFTSAFRPTRKTFFVYFADRRNALPHSYFFEDEDCESQIRCWKWKRSGNNSLKFTESVKEKKLPPGREKSQMESDVDLPVTYIVRDKQTQTPSESGICLSWMHAMMHHCWTTESTEKASNITIFDHFLGVLCTAFVMPSDVGNDDTVKKEKPWNILVDSPDEFTDCKIKDTRGSETKVQADSSKPRTTVDAFKSLRTFEIPRELQFEFRIAEFHESYEFYTEVRRALKALVSKEHLARCTMDASFSGDLTDCTIKVNIGEETKVQADSSNTERTVDAGKSLPAFAIDNCKYRESPTSALYVKLQQLDICQPFVASCVGNTKINCELYGMFESVFIGDTDCKIKGNEAKETKIQADSSKTETTIDAGKSVPTFPLTNCKSQLERVRQACKMSLLDRAEGGSCRSYGTAAREALPFPIPEDVTCLPVQEQGDGYAAPQALILPPGDQPVDLVSSVGNAIKFTVHRFNTEEITQWMQQLTRPLGTDLVMSSGSRNDVSNKKKLNICQPVVSSGVGNTKINHEKWGMVESVFIDQTDSKIKGNEAKETKVEADSSKTKRIVDAGKSLSAFVMAVMRARDSAVRTFRTSRVMPSDVGNDKAGTLLVIICGSGFEKTSLVRAICRKMTMSCTFPDDFTHFKIEGNRGNETKVPAMRPLRTDLLMSSGSTHDDSNKGKLNICKPVAASCVGNIKIICEKDGMVESVFIDDGTDCKIKGNEAKETKIQADSSKTETAIDAGKSVPTFAIEISKITSVPLTNCQSQLERFRQACNTRLLVFTKGGSCRSYWTAAWEALPFPIREDVTCLPVQEKGDGYAAPVNLVSSVGNTEKPTVHRCSTEEINQWKQQLTRSKPLKARKQKNTRDPSVTFKITKVARHRENETPIFTDAVYNDHQEKLFGIRIHPKGVGSGRGRHVALFIHLLKRDFNNSLVWPFAGTITVSVLDQSDSSSRHDISRIIEGNPVLPAFQQPDLSICRTGYGYERFAPIEEFFGPRYVKDDKLVLKIAFPGGMIDTLIRPLRTDFMMSLGSRNDNSNKRKLNMFQPVVSSFVGNTKINRENWGMVESVFIDQTDCKIKDNKAKKTKVQADSSKTATRIDAGKSLPAFTADNSQRTRRHASPIRPFTTALMMSGSRKDDRKKGKRNICQPVVSSFVGNTKINREKGGMVKSVFIGQTDCKIKGNEAKETKVQADSSKTATRIDAGKSLLAFTADTSERTRRLASPIRPFTTALMMSCSRKDDRKKGKRNICQPVVSSFVGNTKINREKWEIVEPVFIGQTDCKIKGNEAKETKVQADPSRTKLTIEAGKSLAGFYKYNFEISRLSSPI